MKTLKGVLVVLGFVFPRSLPVFTADKEKEKTTKQTWFFGYSIVLRINLKE